MKKTMQKISLISILLLTFNCIKAQTVNFNIERVAEVYGTSNTRLLIHPTTNELIAYQGNIAFNSTDQGVNWNLKANFNFPDELGVLEMSSFDPNIVYSGGGSLNRSMDGGNTYMTLPPFPEGSGGVYDIAIHPENASILYVGLEYTLVKSDDYGLTWIDIPLNSTGLPTATKYSKLFIDTDSPSTVFVKTESGGLYKTTDAGLNWLYSGPEYSVGNLKDFCASPNGEVIYQVENDRIYKSDNGGDDWVLMSTINSDESISTIGIKSDNPNIVFFVSMNYSANIYKLYRSVDGGNSFVNTYTFDDYITDFEFGDSWQMSFFTDPINSDIIYLAPEHGAQFMNFMFKSTDAGISWNYMNNEIYNFHISDMTITGNGYLVYLEDNHPYYTTYNINNSNVNKYKSCDYEWITQIVNDPIDADLAWSCSDFGVEKVYNNASSMIKLNTTNPDHFGTAITAVNINETTNIYYATIDQNYTNSDVGLYKSSNGMLFSPLNAPVTNFRITDIIIDTVGIDKIIASTDGNGYFISQNDAIDWVHYTNPGNINDMAINSENSQIIYFAANDAIYKSEDGGITANQITDFASNQIELNPNDYKMIFASSNGKIMYSIDAGTNWTELELITDFNEYLGKFYFEFHPIEANKVYIGSETYGLFCITICQIINMDFSDISCAGENDGTISITATGTEPLKYSIDNGSTFQASNEFTGLSAGEYQITVKDANETIANWNENVVLTDPETVNLGDDFSACEGESLTLDAGNFETFLWNDESTGQTLNITVSGTYSVSVTDVTGCVSTDEITVTVNLLPTVNLGADVEICEGQTTILDAGEGFTAYLWNDETNNQTLEIGTAGTYSVTVTDVNTCENSDEISVSVNPNPVAGFTFAKEVLTVTFTNTSENADLYSWDFGDSNTSTDENPVHTYSISGNYTVELTATSNNCGDNSQTQTVGLPTSIDDLDFNNYVKIIPNPSNGLITLKINNSLTDDIFIEITGINGQVVYKKQFNSLNITELIDLSENTKGIYFMRVRAKDFEKVGKLIIE